MFNRAPGLWLFSALMLVAGGCKCDPKIKSIDESCKAVNGNQADHPASCTSTTECADHFTCVAAKDISVLCCTFTDRKCTTEADCCPGQTCPTDRKKCFDKYLSCETDADCGEKGDRFCTPYSDVYGNSSRCQYKACSSTGSCPEGQSCFGGTATIPGECLVDLPCQGACEPGKGCVADIDRCQDYAKPTGRETAACPMTCNAGFIATFKDPKNIWDSCKLPEVACVCAELPGLRSEDLGRFSALAAEGGKGLFVSEYDGQFGDLAVARFDLTGKALGIDYVDGVPAAAVKYGPSGARGGVIELGDDVGRYTDIAVGGNGFVYVSYYDVTHGDLKVAIRNTEGKWASHTVDGLTGDLGLYTSLALDSDGVPGVSYFQRSGESTFDSTTCPAPIPTGPKAFITALKFARATKTIPVGASDWVVKTVACQSRPTPPCNSCATGAVCADPGAGPDCYTPATTCTGCDPNTDTCVTVGTAAQCAKKYNPSTLNDITDGVGLFSALGFNGKEAVIGFMKRATRRRWARPASTRTEISTGCKSQAPTPRERWCGSTTWATPATSPT